MKTALTDLELLALLSSDVLDKQYRLYAWTDTKMQALITTNSILFAAAGFFYPQCLGDRAALAALSIAVMMLSVSLGLCLWEVVPRISSGKSGEATNVRSLRGITAFASWRDYHDALKRHSREADIEDAARQVYGMATNNIRSSRTVAHGSRLTAIAVVATVTALVFASLGVRGVHVLGEWQPPSITTSAPPGAAGSGSSSLPVGTKMGGPPTQQQPTAGSGGGTTTPPTRPVPP